MQKCKKARSKLDDELKDFKGSQKATAVSKAVCAVLKSLCENEAFALAALELEKTLTKCCEEAMRGVGNCVSDQDVYRKAVKYYLPNADIRFEMALILSKENATGTAPEPATETRRPMVNLLDYL